MEHPIGSRLPIIGRWFSAPVVAQSGDRYSVKQTRSGSGPSERLVVDFNNLDDTLINITMGQSGHVTSAHFADQFNAWVKVEPIRLPYSESSVGQDARHTLTLRPLRGTEIPRG